MGREIGRYKGYERDIGLGRIREVMEKEDYRAREERDRGL